MNKPKVITFLSTLRKLLQEYDACIWYSLKDMSMGMTVGNDEIFMPSSLCVNDYTSLKLLREVYESKDCGWISEDEQSEFINPKPTRSQEPISPDYYRNLRDQMAINFYIHKGKNMEASIDFANKFVQALKRSEID